MSIISDGLIDTYVSDRVQLEVDFSPDHIIPPTFLQCMRVWIGCTCTAEIPILYDDIND
jgi:hypothetical protein